MSLICKEQLIHKKEKVPKGAQYNLSSEKLILNIKFQFKGDVSPFHMLL